MALGRLWWVTSDSCSLAAAGMTLVLTLFAQFVIVKMLLLPWLGATNPHVLAFLGLTLLSIAAHCKSQFTDPGACPLRDPKPLRTQLFAEHMQRQACFYDERVSHSLDEPEEASECKEGLRRRNQGEPADEDKKTTVAGSVVEDVKKPLKEVAPPSLRQTPRTCGACRSVKPLSAHHCRICGRCVLLQDHHCPYLNNCVGIFNQKYFFQFLIYMLLSCIYAFVLLVARFVSCSARPTRACRSISTVETVCFILVFIEALIFGVFVSVMLFEQLCAVFTPEEELDWDDEAHAGHGSAADLPEDLSNEEAAFFARLDAERLREGAGLSRMQLLRQVFGGPPGLSWILPTSPVHPEIRKRYEELLEDNLVWVRARPRDPPTAASVRRNLIQRDGGAEYASASSSSAPVNN